MLWPKSKIESLEKGLWYCVSIYILSHAFKKSSLFYIPFQNLIEYLSSFYVQLHNLIQNHPWISEPSIFKTVTHKLSAREQASWSKWRRSYLLLVFAMAFSVLCAERTTCFALCCASADAVSCWPADPKMLNTEDLPSAMPNITVAGSIHSGLYLQNHVHYFKAAFCLCKYGYSKPFFMHWFAIPPSSRGNSTKRKFLWRGGWASHRDLRCRLYCCPSGWSSLPRGRSPYWGTMPNGAWIGPPQS